MSYNKSIFDFTEKRKPNKSRFNLSHEWKSQIVPGELVPVLLEEAMPGDEFSISSEFSFQFAPMYFPLAQIYTMRCDYFYIPNRILFPVIDIEGEGQFNAWEYFIMGENRKDGGLGMTTIPTCQVQNQIVTNNDNRTLASYFGLPLLPQGAGRQFEIEDLNCIPFFAYLSVYDNIYRNPQVEPRRFVLIDPDGSSVQTQLRDGFRTTGNTFPDRFPCLSAKWEKDYFTSATPEPQFGAELLIPSLGIDEDGNYIPQQMYNPDGSQPTTVTLKTNPDGTLGDGADPIVLETNASIRQLRRAEIMQSFWEKVNRVGTRIKDFMQGIHGTNPTAGLIQTPVMFGSCFGRVKITSVMTQALTEVAGAQGQQTGDYTGHANLYENDGQTHRIQTQEHGYYMAILQINPNTSYGQGIDRHWRRSIMEDFPYDMFAGLGDQEILKEELIFQNLTSAIAQNQLTFGYIDRFAEMKYRNNRYCGDMSWGQGLSWHAGRYADLTDLGVSYAQLAEISEMFTNSSDTPNYPSDEVNLGNRLTDQFRVLPQGAAGNSQENVIFAHIFHSVSVNRQLPFYSKPGKMII